MNKCGRMLANNVVEALITEGRVIQGDKAVAAIFVYFYKDLYSVQDSHPEDLQVSAGS